MCRQTRPVHWILAMGVLAFLGAWSRGPMEPRRCTARPSAQIPPALQASRPVAVWQWPQPLVRAFRPADLEAPLPADPELPPYDRAGQLSWIRSLPEDLQDRVVWLKSRAFLPRPAGEVSLPEGGGCVYLQFGDLPGPETVRSLEEAGVRLVRHVTGRTWLARADAASLSAVSGQHGILGAASAQAADRMAPGLAEACARGVPVLLRIDRRGKPLPEAESLALAAPYVREARIEGPGLLSCHADPRALEALLSRTPEVAFAAPSGGVKGTTNAVAAEMSGIDRLNAAGFDGAGALAALIDHGHPRLSHQELGGRVLEADGPGEPTDHATHAAGTLAAFGFDLRARGMAPGLSGLLAYSWDAYTANLADAGTRGAAVACLPWGLRTGQDWSGTAWIDLGGSERFGDYSLLSQVLDGLALEHPGMTQVWPVGNDRDDGTPSAHDGRMLQVALANPYADLVDTLACAKNVLAVGSLGSPGFVAEYSSWGPTDDGRIRPEVCARGTALWSCLAGSDTHYGANTGTSQAAAVVAGGAACLAPSLGRSDLCRALLAHTAEDLLVEAGYPGPDVMTGYGMADFAAAGAVLAAEDPRLWLGEIADGQVADVGMLEVKPGDPELRTTICWLDPPGDPSAARALVNDLDLSVLDPMGVEHPLAWTLDPADPARPAVQGRNAVDTLEVVSWKSPPPGSYRIRIRGTSIVTPTQVFALVTDRRVACDAVDGEPGAAVVVDAPLVQGAPVTLRISGAPGAAFKVLASSSVLASPQARSGWSGDWWLSAPLVLGSGTLDGGGFAVLALSKLPDALDRAGQTVYLQAEIGAAGAGGRLTARTDLPVGAPPPAAGPQLPGKGKGRDQNRGKHKGWEKQADRCRPAGKWSDCGVEQRKPRQ